MGRPLNSADRSETSRSDRFHSANKEELKRVVSHLARTENTYTYREIGTVQLNLTKSVTT